MREEIINFSCTELKANGMRVALVDAQTKEIHGKRNDHGT